MMKVQIEEHSVNSDCDGLVCVFVSAELSYKLQTESSVASIYNVSFVNVF